MRRKMKNAAYLLNPFEMEAYRRMYDLEYLNGCADGATEWQRYAKMPLEERLRHYLNNYKQLSYEQETAGA